MKRRVILLALAALLCGGAASAIEKSQTVVYINGAKYYIHTVQPKETVYSLAKTYGVAEETILEYNPEVRSDGLKTAQNIKIPCPVEPAEKMSEKKIRRTFDKHVVAQGETLYGISRRYSIALQTIMEDNPSLDPLHLKPGECILIRKKAQGDRSEAASQAEWEAYKDTLNSVAGEEFAYHVVHIGETFYSISRRFAISEEDLSELNDGLRPEDLKVGAIIKVPGTPRALTDGSDSTSVAEALHKDLAPQSEEVSFIALSPSEQLRIALLLPLAQQGGAASGNYLEFYQGFLLGLEEVKSRGYSVHLDLFNTAHDLARVEEIVADETFRNADLIVGPVYEDVLAPVVSHAERHAVPVVSPLAQIGHIDSDVLFQLSPAAGRKYAKLTDLTAADTRVTLIYSEHTDKEFEAEILAVLGDKPYAKHTYRYQHPSQASADDGSDLTPLLQQEGRQIFVVMADNEVDVDRILAAIASADTGIVSRGLTAPQFAVVGNARWNRYANIDRTMFFKDRVTMVSSYHAKRDAEAVKEFDSRYVKAFGTLPTLYSYRGYDVAALFAPAMYGDIQYDMEGRTYTPLQTSYLFAQPEGRHIHVNQQWVRLNYRPDFTITLE